MIDYVLIGKTVQELFDELGKCPPCPMYRLCPLKDTKVHDIVKELKSRGVTLEETLEALGQIKRAFELGLVNKSA